MEYAPAPYEQALVAGDSPGLASRGPAVQDMGVVRQRLRSSPLPGSRRQLGARHARREVRCWPATSGWPGCPAASRTPSALRTRKPRLTTTTKPSTRAGGTRAAERGALRPRTSPSTTNGAARSSPCSWPAGPGPGPRQLPRHRPAGHPPSTECQSGIVVSNRKNASTRSFCVVDAWRIAIGVVTAMTAARTCARRSPRAGGQSRVTRSRTRTSANHWTELKISEPVSR